MASLTFTAFGKKFRTASTAAYIIVCGPYDHRAYGGTTTYRTEAHVHGYAYSLGAAQKRVRRQLSGVPSAIISLKTGLEVPK